MGNNSLGYLLAELRKGLGLTQNDIAQKIYISCAIVKQIEENKVGNIPFVFVKGYIRAYAEIVGMPPESYQTYIDEMQAHDICYSTQIKNYTDSNRTLYQLILIMLFILIICIFFGTIVYILKDNQDSLVELKHYITPYSSDDQINS